MKKTLIVILGACTALTACAPDHSNYANDGRSGYDGRSWHRDGMERAQRMADHKMQMFDTNNDGRISRTEWNAGMKRKFAKMDTNGDGYITRDELIAAETREHNKMRGYSRDGDRSMGQYTGQYSNQYNNQSSGQYNGQYGNANEGMAYDPTRTGEVPSDNDTGMRNNGASRPDDDYNR